MLKTETLYSLADISIIPAKTTDIKSRSECNPKRIGLEEEDYLLPIIVSPMSCNWIGGITDAEIYKKAGINTIIPARLT